MTINIGYIAPDFTLKDTDGNDVSLSDFNNNNIVLLFFPLAFTKVCTSELCFVRDNLKEFYALNAKVIAISVDSFFVLNEFKKQQNYNMILLSDFNKEVSSGYGAIYEDFLGYKGVSKRAAFVISKERRVVHVEILEKASELPDFESIKDCLGKMI